VTITFNVSIFVHEQSVQYFDNNMDYFHSSDSGLCSMPRFVIHLLFDVCACQSSFSWLQGHHEILMLPQRRRVLCSSPPLLSSILCASSFLPRSCHTLLWGSHEDETTTSSSSDHFKTQKDWTGDFSKKICAPWGSFWRKTGESNCWFDPETEQSGLYVGVRVDVASCWNRASQVGPSVPSKALQRGCSRHVSRPGRTQDTDAGIFTTYNSPRQRNISKRAMKMSDTLLPINIEEEVWL